MSDQVGGQENKPGTDGENAKPKGTGSSNSDSIRIKVREASGLEILFRVKMTTQMKKIKEKYCEKSSKDIGHIRFLFDGEAINDEMTPKQLDMEPDDIIEVVTAQTGGYLTHL